MLQNGEWPWFDDGEHGPEQEARDRYNRDGLVDLLRASGEQTIELYGVWDGDFTIAPALREEIALVALLDPSFRLRSEGFTWCASSDQRSAVDCLYGCVLKVCA
jgi:hypothetical protein